MCLYYLTFVYTCIQIIFAITGHSKSGGSSVKYMDIRNDNDLKWKPSDHIFFLPPRKDTTMVVSKNGIILAIGGVNESGNTFVTLVDELDLKSKSKQWVSTRPLNQPRTHFAVGGYNESNTNRLNSIEYYDTNSKVWTEIEPMPTARYRCSAVVVSNKLYVFGGYNDRSLAIVEYYDFKKKHWKQLEMPICNHTMGLSRIDNVIYLIGGSLALRQVFKFDLQHFKWDQMPDMNMDCNIYCSSVVIMKNDLFVFVNNRGKLHCKRYDRQKNQWQLVNMAGTELSLKSHIITFNDITLKSYGIQI